MSAHSSQAGSISGPPAGPPGNPGLSHGYKKSLSSKADPNTALTEDQPSKSSLPPYSIQKSE